MGGRKARPAADAGTLSKVELATTGLERISFGEKLKPQRACRRRWCASPNNNYCAAGFWPCLSLELLLDIALLTLETAPVPRLWLAVTKIDCGVRARKRTINCKNIDGMKEGGINPLACSGLETFCQARQTNTLIITRRPHPQLHTHTIHPPFASLR